MLKITRRSLIIGTSTAATIAAGFPPVAHPAEAVTLEEFRALSARLTGADVASLDATAAAKLLDGFISLGRGPDLAALAADPAASTGKLANDIVAAWYSGRYASHTGPATIDLNHALLWGALDFTKPPGVCGGDTGYWAKPYQS